jgi:hypothetical protein
VDEVKRPDPRCEVQHGVDVAHGGSDSRAVEQVEFGPRWSPQLVSCRFCQRPQRAAQHPGSTGNQKAHR